MNAQQDCSYDREGETLGSWSPTVSSLVRSLKQALDILSRFQHAAPGAEGRCAPTLRISSFEGKMHTISENETDNLFTYSKSEASSLFCERPDNIYVGRVGQRNN